MQRVGSSFLTRNRTWGLCVGSTEPQPLDQQGGPCILIFLCPFSSLFTPQFKGFAAPTTRRPCVRKVAFLSALLLTLLAKRAWAASLASSPCRPSGWPLPTRGKATPGPSLAATPTPYPLSCYPPRSLPPTPHGPHRPYLGSSRGAGHQPVPPSLDFPGSNLTPAPVSLRLCSHRLDSSSKLQGLNLK